MKKIYFIIASIAAVWGLRAEAATLSVQPQGSSIAVQEEFGIDIKLDTESVSANAVQATIQFPRDLLEIVRVDKTQSVFTFWLEEPVIDASAGTIRFTAGSTSGLSGQSLHVLTVVLRMKGSGSAEISLTGSAVTAADGAGTNILYRSRGLTISTAAPDDETQEVVAQIPLIPKPEQITRPEVPASSIPVGPLVTVPFYPDQSAWHNLSSPFLAQWELPADVNAVAAVINHDPTFAPTISEGLFDDKMFPALPDGISYLHVRFRNALGWGSTTHYRLAVDTTPPVGFVIGVAEGTPSLVPNPTLTYKSADQLSGLSRYVIRVDTAEQITVSDPSYTLDVLGPGEHTVRVLAEDRAGNSTETTIQLEILPIPSPILSSLNKDLYVGEGNLFASGTAASDVVLMLTLTDSKGAVVATQAVTPNDAGEWSVNIDTPLKRGDYTFVVVASDERGAQSYPVTETIDVRSRPLLTIFGLGISPLWFCIFTSLILIGAIVLGIFIERYRRRQRSLRVFVLERDATNLIRHMREDLVILATKQQSTEGLDAAERIQINLKKMEEYVIESMGKINK